MKTLLPWTFSTRGMLGESWPRAFLSGVLLAERCQEALLARATGAGAELWFDRPMTGWRAGDDGARVEIAGGEVRARSVVLATGGWLADAAAGPEVRLSVERQVQHWFEPHAGAYVSDLPPFVWELEGGRSWYGLPDLGEGLKVGMHHGGEPTTAESLRREVDPAESREMRRLLEQNGALVETDGCFELSAQEEDIAEIVVNAGIVRGEAIEAKENGV